MIYDLLHKCKHETRKHVNCQWPFLYWRRIIRLGEVITIEEGLVSEKFNIAEKCLPEDIERR